MTTFAHSLAVLIGIDAYTGGIPRLTRLLAAQHGYETILLTEPAAGEPMTLARLRGSDKTTRSAKQKVPRF